MGSAGRHLPGRGPRTARLRHGRRCRSTEHRRCDGRRHDRGLRADAHRLAWRCGIPTGLTSAAAPRAATAPRWARGGVLRETTHNSHALLAFFALSNADVDHRPRHAGRAPGGSVRRRADLVQGGAVPAAVRGRDRIPVDGEPRRRQADAPGQPRGGHAHRRGHHPRAWRCCPRSRWCSSAGRSTPSSQGQLWAFALLGTLLAMLQLMIYNIVARQRQRTVLLVWVAFLALYASTPFVNSLDGCCDRGAAWTPCCSSCCWCAASRRRTSTQAHHR